MEEPVINQPEKQPQKQNNRSLLYILLILLLVGINIYLYVKYYQKDTQNQQLTAQVNTDSIRIADLDQKYQEALVQIESYKGQNAKLDSIIAEKEKELMSMRANIDNVKKQKKLSDEDYKKQINALNDIIVGLQDQVAKLEEENKVLYKKNDSLGTSLASQMSTNTQLQNVNKQLTKKVDIASLLKPTTITSVGVYGKSSGKEKETNSAKKAEKIKVCFTVPQNDVAEPGMKTFLVRIISPEGVTLAIQSSGSGVFKMADGTEQRQYTTSTQVSYDKTAQDVCTYWAQNTGFAAGSYSVEIYQDGYQVGTTSMELK